MEEVPLEVSLLVVLYRKLEHVFMDLGQQKNQLSIPMQPLL